MKQANQSGTILMIAIASTTIFLASLIGLVSLVMYEQKLYTQQAAKHEATHMAEAGINYYVWLLAHEELDYYDGTGHDPGPAGPPYGPYVHTFIEPAGGLTGTYSLEITPPVSSSTIVTIKSTGWMNKYPNIKSEILVQYGKPSLAHFSFLTNVDAWFGENESLSGEVHANGGIRMDGSNDALVTSLKATYTCLPSHDCICSCSPASKCTNASFCPGLACCGETKPGIWGAGPNSSLWEFPVPIVDFNLMSTNLVDFQAAALNFGPSGGSNKGYHVIFKNNGTFDVYIVNTLKAAIKQLNDDWSAAMVNIAEEINTQTLKSNYPIPANGEIFFEDDIWVEGVVKGRATVVAAKLGGSASQWKTIHINNNINYFARDGHHILGLIAQKHIKVPRHAPTDLTIDAILLALNGHVYRSYYSTHIVTNSITIYGGILSKQDWNWTWVNGVGAVTDGYTHTASIYDPQVTYSAPPAFPTTSDFAFISWDED